MNTQFSLNHMIHSLSLYQFLTETEFNYDQYLFLSVTEGECDITLDSSTTRTLSVNELVLLPPWTRCSLSPSPSCVCLILQISPRFLLECFSPVTVFRQAFFSADFPVLKDMQPYLYQLARLWRAPSPTPEYRAIGLLFSCLESFRMVLQTISADKSNDCCDSKYDRLFTYIEQHISEPLSLHQTAQAVGLTPQYLSAFFQKNRNCTFMDYVNGQKAEAAKIWMKYTSCSEKEIAEKTGFKTIAAFQKCIRDFPETSLYPESGYIQKLPDSAILTEYPVSLPGISGLSEEPAIPEQTLAVSSGFPETLIQADSKSVVKLPDSWKKLLNIGFACHLSDSALRKQLIDFQTRYHFQYGRICRIFDLVTIRQINNKTYYGFDLIFQILDLMQSIDLIPFLDIGNKYAKANYCFSEYYVFSSNETPQEHYQKTAHVLPEFIRACCNRYGSDTVEKWHFEIYFDIISQSHTKLTYWQYLNYYRKLEHIIHEFLPACPVGGPGFNTYASLTELKNLLQTAQEEQIRFDFFSIYIYACTEGGNTPHLSLDPDIMTTRTRQSVQLIHKFHPNAPVYVTEFNFSFMSRNFLNDTLFQSSLIARYLTQNLDIVQGLGYFVMSDISTRYTDSDGLFFGGNGLYNYCGIRKPSFYAYAYYHELGNFLVDKGENYIITLSSFSSFQAVFFHYTHITPEAAQSEQNKLLLTDPQRCFETDTPRSFHVRIPGAVPGIYMVKSYLLSENSGNVLPFWSKSPAITELHEKDLTFFKHLSHPATDMYSIEVSENKVLEFSICLNPQDMVLLQIDYNSAGSL